MTKRIVRLAVVAAAAASIVLPASAANAALPCVPFGTFEICLPEVST
jgi:hypothetical protein